MIPTDEILKLLPKNAGMHNSIYRGKDITDLFYDGTLSEQIANGTFDDIFIGDYIIGKVSKRKYLVAGINYRLHTGNIECNTPHVLMIPEKIMGNEKMNASASTTGAYIKSEMYTKYIDTYRTIIKNDFDVEHILTHNEFFQNTVTNGYSSAGVWTASDIDLMNELMVYGAYIFTPLPSCSEGSNIISSDVHTIDKSQLPLFKLKPDLIVASDDEGTRKSYWLRDVCSSNTFAYISDSGLAHANLASNSFGVRPAFLVY